MTRRRVFLALPAIALGCLLALPEPSFAQLRAFRGAGFGGMGYGGLGGYGSTYSPTWGGYNGYSGYGNYGYNPSSYGVYSPMYQTYGPGYGGYTAPYYVGATGTGYASTVPTGEYWSFYPSSTTDNTRARIHVQVPANAKVFFDNSATQQTGTERNFISPPLEPNYKYSYQVSARWKDKNGEEHRVSRTVRVAPGKAVHVDFMAAANTGNNNNNQVRQSSPFDGNTPPNRNQQNLNPNPQNPNPQPPNQKQPPPKTPLNQTR